MGPVGLRVRARREAGYPGRGRRFARSCSSLDRQAWVMRAAMSGSALAKFGRPADHAPEMDQIQAHVLLLVVHMPGLQLQSRRARRHAAAHPRDEPPRTGRRGPRPAGPGGRAAACATGSGRGAAGRTRRPLAGRAAAMERAPGRRAADPVVAGPPRSRRRRTPGRPGARAATSAPTSRRRSGAAPTT